MKSMINKMLKKAGLMIYSMFAIWKLETFTDVERRRALRRNKILNRSMDVLDKKYRNHLKSAVTKISALRFNTNIKSESSTVCPLSTLED